LNKNYVNVAQSAPVNFPQLPPTVAAGAQVDPSLPVGSRGFYIMLTVTTPNVGGFRYVYGESYVPALKKLDLNFMTKENASNKGVPREHYIALVMTPINSHNLVNDPQWPGAFGASYDAAVKLAPQNYGAQVDTRNQGPNGAAAVVQLGPGGVNPLAWNDRFTNEPRQNDWTMQIPIIVVVVDSPTTPGH
jgi:hypothetical protein